jgi:hypothetical protein
LAGAGAGAGGFTVASLAAMERVGMTHFDASDFTSRLRWSYRWHRLKTFVIGLAIGLSAAWLVAWWLK